MGGDRGDPGRLHAGRFRPRRDRLLPGEARRSRREHELRHLRPRLRRLLVHRLPAGLRWFRRRVLRRSGRTSPSEATCSAVGNWVFLWQGGWATVRQCDHARAARPSSSTWSPSWTPSPRSRPGRWPSAGSGSSFVIWGLFCGAIYYPLFAAWTWGGGWLAKTWDTMSLGSRLRRLRRLAAWSTPSVARRRSPVHSSSGPVSASSDPTASHGRCRATTSRWPCSARSSCCSAGSASTPPRRSRRPTSSSPRSPTNTAIAGAVGAIVAMCWITRRTGKPDPGMMVNGMLAGLVAITAPCAFVTPSAVGGDRCHRRGARDRGGVLHRAQRKVDDPVGAIAVHGVGGTFGVLCVGIFANGSYGAGWNGVGRRGRQGAVLGASAASSAPSCSGVVVIWTVIFGIAFAFFKIQNGSPRDGQGRHPLQGRRRARRARHPRDGCPGPYPEFVRTGQHDTEAST